MLYEGESRRDMRYILRARWMLIAGAILTLAGGIYFIVIKSSFMKAPGINDANYASNSNENSDKEYFEFTTDKKMVNKFSDYYIMSSKYKETVLINKDVVGWISIPNTRIDYPVVKGKDNDYYLYHDILKRTSVYGTIFMDYRNDIKLLNENTSLFGHHMKDGSMFQELVKYKDKDFFEANRYIYLFTEAGSSTWEVFSAYVTDTNFYFIQNEFSSLKEYENFINKIQAKSKYKSNVSVSTTDKIITLCTCTYEFNDARFVVHAKKIN